MMSFTTVQLMWIIVILLILIQELLSRARFVLSARMTQDASGKQLIMETLGIAIPVGSKLLEVMPPDLVHAVVRSCLRGVAKELFPRSGSKGSKIAFEGDAPWWAPLAGQIIENVRQAPPDPPKSDIVVEDCSINHEKS